MGAKLLLTEEEVDLLEKKELDFVEKLYNFFKTEREKHKREEGVYWVTDLVSCRKKEKYSRMYPELELSYIFNPIFVQGTILHMGLEHLLEEILTDEGWLVEIEKEATMTINPKEHLVSSPIDAPILLKGRIDVYAVNDTTKIGIEIKTARADLSLPHEHHIDQVKMYNTLYGLNESYLIYVTPDRVTQYVVSDKMSLGEIAKRIVEDAAPRYPWECQYCPFSVLCPRKVTKKVR